jgi:hypothetical protein
VVEAGERLGFLPGDVQAKLNPYLRPIYDSLYDLLDFEDVSRLEGDRRDRVAPLAFMRGRTLSAPSRSSTRDTTTVAQMKMFLTRMGEGSRMVVTGDPTQSDLDESKKNGLLDATARLRGYKDIGFVEFGVRDIVRHPPRRADRQGLRRPGAPIQGGSSRRGPDVARMRQRRAPKSPAGKIEVAWSVPAASCPTATCARPCARLFATAGASSSRSTSRSSRTRSSRRSTSGSSTILRRRT